MPKVGSKYEKIMRDGTIHVLTVIEVKGKVKYKLGKQIFDSPSGAAKYIKGGHEVNGWAFWKID